MVDIFEWYQVVGAVIAGNILTGCFVYYLWYMTNREKRGMDTKNIPLGVALCGALPPLLVAAGLYLFA